MEKEKYWRVKDESIKSSTVNVDKFIVLDGKGNMILSLSDKHKAERVCAFHNGCFKE